MGYEKSIRAALKGAAPYVAIPVEGHAPVCVRSKLLKGALKGVIVDKIDILGEGSARYLKVIGHGANGYFVRTSCKILSVHRNIALKENRDWAIKQHDKMLKKLPAAELRALRLKKAEQAGIQELLRAQKDVAEIYREAREYINPPMRYVKDEERKDIENDYLAFRKQRKIRKQASVIRWKIAQLREQLAKITVTKGRRGERKKTFARKHTDIPRMLLLRRQIELLEKEFERMCPPVWYQSSIADLGGWWNSTWITKRRTGQTCFRVAYWRDDEERDLKAIAQRLKDRRADVRALTPPQDEAESIRSQRG